MILDSLSLWHRYAPLHPRFARAFAFLEQVGPEVALGRHEIADDSIFALVQRYTTRPVEGMQLEAHRRYIDVQYLVSGREVIHWAPLRDLAHVTQPYDTTKDAGLFALSPATVPVPLRAGQFMILFPDDAHAPCCCVDTPAEVVKVVVKVEVAGYTRGSS
jgi:YhcH/YjgK/YiaL family protein